MKPYKTYEEAYSHTLRGQEEEAGKAIVAFGQELVKELRRLNGLRLSRFHPKTFLNRKREAKKSGDYYDEGN